MTAPCRLRVRASAPLLALLLSALPATALAGQNKQSICGKTSLDISFADTIYQALNDNGPGKVGPRRLVVNQSGKVVSQGTRLFVQGTPMDIDTATVRIKKTDGKGKTGVAICATDENDRQTVLKEFTIENGKDNIGQTYTRTLTGIENKRISVNFEGKSLTNSMSYDMFFERPNAGTVWQPNKNVHPSQAGPVPGFADLHAHHAARFAFGAAWYWGDMWKTRNGVEGMRPCPSSHYNMVDFSVLGLNVSIGDHAGKTHGHPDYRDWPWWDDTSHQQIGWRELKRAHDGGMTLMVGLAVSSQWICAGMAAIGRKEPQYHCQDMESAKLQILEMKRFAEENDWYEIVRDPWEARRAIHEGKLAVVLGVEVSNIMPSSDGDWERQLDELYDMGVRVIYIAHETNTDFAGAAYHHYPTLGWANRLKAWFSNDIEYASEGKSDRNALGLTPKGKSLVRAMIDRNMLIDVDHLSRKAINDIWGIVKDEDYYPIYAGHTRVGELLPSDFEDDLKEFYATKKMLERIRDTGGMVGMRTGPEGMEAHTGSNVDNDCDGSVKSLIQTYAWLDEFGLPATFGTDLNGFVENLGPRFGQDACPGASSATRPAQKAAQVLPSTKTMTALAGPKPSGWARYVERGVSDIGALPSVVYDMKLLGVDTANIESSSEAYLKMWERTYDDNRRKVVTFTKKTRQIDPSTPSSKAPPKGKDLKKAAGTVPKKTSRPSKNAPPSANQPKGQPLSPEPVNKSPRPRTTGVPKKSGG